MFLDYDTFQTNMKGARHLCEKILAPFKMVYTKTNCNLSHDFLLPVILVYISTWVVANVFMLFDLEYDFYSIFGQKSLSLFLVSNQSMLTVST